MIESFLLAPALALSAQGHVFDNFNDAELCGVISRNMTNTPPVSPPIMDTSLQADCGAKRIRATVDLDLTGEAFDQFIVLFIQTARAGVCDMSNQTMATFKQRGWGFAYTFEAADGEVVKQNLDC